MPTIRCVAVLTAASITVSLNAGGIQGQPADTAVTTPQAVITRYCVACHNEKQRAAGLSPFTFDALDVNRVSASAETWEKVLTKLRTASMPPPGLPRPEPATYDTMATWLETELDRAAAAAPNPGLRPSLHRLNRAEYQNAVRDLLAVDHLPKELDISSLLPADDTSFGFDNIADALGTTPTLIERYLAAAQKLSALAVGDPSIPVIVDTYRIPPQLPQDDRFDGLPFGTRGGINIRRSFPLDGEYVIRLAVTNARSADLHQLEISMNGERVQIFTIGDGGAGRGRGRGGAAPGPASPAGARPADAPAAGGAPEDTPAGDPPYAPPAAPLQVRHAVKAGSHLLTVAFVKKTSALAEQNVRPLRRTGQGDGPPEPSLASVVISGPYNVTGSGNTPSRERIFSCQPKSGSDEQSCASQILSALARRAYRRPVTQADLQVLMPFYREGKTDGGFEKGIQRAIERILVSPAFLFRVERDPATVVGGIRDIELASRLSFFLWSSIPDDELLDAAAAGELRNAGALERQVRRMLDHPRADALIDNFAGQWLYLRNLDAAAPDPRIFPDFDEGLRRAMRRETELFFASIVRENRSVLDLLTANYTFVNERLAKHYGIANVYGDQFRRVTLDDPARRGILGHASILTVTSYPHRTSPVLRGKWIMESVLGTPPPPPPADVPALVETSKSTGKALTMREAMAAHRSNPSCASCHARMDPLGFAFENFDAVGRWRTMSANAPVDASGALPDGTRFDGAAGLRDALLRHPGQFAETLAERLLTYALGRGVEFYDRPAIRAITREAAANDHRFASLVTGIVKSVPFQMRKKTGS
jgi:mono/diheme cytochrome c family protein